MTSSRSIVAQRLASARVAACQIELLEARQLFAAAYTLVEVGTLPGFSVFRAEGLNDSGHVVGTALTSALEDTGAGFVFRNGTTSAVAGAITANDINNAGQIIGKWRDASVENPLFAAGYVTGPSGQLINLDPAKDSDIGVEPYDINNDGLIVGRVVFSSGDASAMYYQNGARNFIPVGEGFINGAWAVNDSDLVVGEIGFVTFSHAFRWQLGAVGVQDLTPEPDDEGNFPNEIANGVNNQGQILISDRTNGRSLLFQGNGPGQDLGQAGGNVFLASGLADNGTVVGTAGGKAYIKENGQFADLNTLVTGKPLSINLADAVAINASGQIVVNGTKNGAERVFLLTPSGTGTPGAVSGTFFHDVSQDGTRNGGEGPLVGWTAYADLNDNGIVEGNEPKATSSADGSYTISGLAPGTYRIREDRKTGWTRTKPAGVFPQGFYDVAVVAGQTRTGNDFGNFEPSGGGTNTPPVPVNDAAGTVRGFPVNIDVLGNDADPDGSLVPSSIAFTTQPAHGNVSLNPTTGVVTFTPESGYVGPDSFAYTVKDDDNATSAPATVSVNIAEVGGSLPGPDLATTSVTAKVPAAAVGGDKAKNSKVKMRVENVGDTIAQGPVLLRVFVSSDATLDGGDTLVNELSKNVKIKPNKGKNFTVKIPSFPAVADGSYRLVATVVTTPASIPDTDPANDSAAATDVVTIAAPFVAVDATFATLPISPLASNKKSSVSVRVENDGNVDYKGPVSVVVLASADGAVDGLDQSLETVEKNVNLKPGKSKVIKVKFDAPTVPPAPSFFLAATATATAQAPAGSTLTDSAVSGSLFTVAS